MCSDPALETAPAPAPPMATEISCQNLQFRYLVADSGEGGLTNQFSTSLLPQPTQRVQTQEITVRGNDFYTPYFTLPTNSPPTHQPHSILSYPSRTLYFGPKFEPSRTLYFGTEGVNIYVTSTFFHLFGLLNVD
jgi:hypothetical protein